MARISFRDSILAISPTWLRERADGAIHVAGAIAYAIGTGMDALADWCIAGVEARWPGLGASDSLGYIGNDRDLERGPREADDTYVVRLRQAWDTHLNAGNAFTLIDQLRAFFLPDVAPPMRLVTNTGWWHVWDGATTVKVFGDNPWHWDAFVSTPRWWRGWVVIDGTDLWDPDDWTDTDDDLWGDGGTWGGTMSDDEATRIRAIIRKWKPRNVTVKNVLVLFASDLFRPTDAANPDTMEEPATQVTYDDVLFLGAIGN